MHSRRFSEMLAVQILSPYPLPPQNEVLDPPLRCSTPLLSAPFGDSAPPSCVLLPPDYIFYIFTLLPVLECLFYFSASTIGNAGPAYAGDAPQVAASKRTIFCKNTSIRTKWHHGTRALNITCSWIHPTHAIEF